jgi:hypothetical protein
MLKSRARLLRHRLVMKALPMFEEAYFRAYKEHWETAIRLGRQRYVASIARGAESG